MWLIKKRILKLTVASVWYHMLLGAIYERFKYRVSQKQMFEKYENRGRLTQQCFWFNTYNTMTDFLNMILIILRHLVAWLSILFPETNVTSQFCTWETQLFTSVFYMIIFLGYFKNWSKFFYRYFTTQKSWFLNETELWK